MSNSTLKEQIQQKINTEQIKPTAKWFFDAKNAGLWLVGVLALVIGSLAVAVALDVILNNDWDMAHEFGLNKFTFIASTLPYLWIIAVILFLLLAEREVRNTKHGYKYATLHIGGGLLICTVVLGGVLYATGIGAATDDAMAHRFSAYRTHGNPQYVFWSDPESGRLAGVVAIVEDEENFVLIDMSGDLWDVSAKDAKNPMSAIIAEQARLKLFGTKQQEMQFLASKIMPFHKGPDVPKALRYRHELHQQRLDSFIKQSHERNFSPVRTR